ncbi:MAG: hypothetical protein O0X93_09100, partial [Methanocorpusculum sp.]|nr:hypothetical protein [Methanocorpusculum sp.]
DMVPDVWGETIGGGEEKPDFPYEIFNSRSWKKFVTDAQKDWSTSVPEKTIFFDDNNGEYYYSYIPYSSHLTKEEALKNPSLDQFMELRPKGTVVKINLPPSAPDEMRKPADILNNGYNNYWADGKSPKMGTLFEDTQGKIYLWFEKDTNEYDQWSTTIPGAHWKLIGKEIFAS